MTVQELIDKLQEIPDKDTQITLNDGAYLYRYIHIIKSWIHGIYVIRS